MPKFLLIKHSSDPNFVFPDGSFDSLWVGLLPNGTLWIFYISNNVSYDSNLLALQPQWLSSPLTAASIYNITVVFLGSTMTVFVNSTQRFSLDCVTIIGSRCQTTSNLSFILPGRWEYYVKPPDESLMLIPSSGIWSMYSSQWRCKRQCDPMLLSSVSLSAANSYSSSLWTAGDSAAGASATVTGALTNNTGSTSSGRFFRFYNASWGFTYGATYFSSLTSSVGPYGMLSAKISFVVDVGSVGIPSAFCLVKKTDISGSVVDYLAFCIEEGSIVTIDMQRLGGVYSYQRSPLAIPSLQSNSFDVQIYWSALQVFVFVNNSLAIVYTESSTALPSSLSIPAQPGYFIMYTLLNAPPTKPIANTTWMLSDFQYSCGDAFAVPPNLALCSSGECVGSVTLVTGGLDLSNSSSVTISNPTYIERNLTVPPNRLLQVEITSTNVAPLTVQGCATLSGSLDVILPSDYVPKSTNNFTIIASKCIEGNFRQITVNTSRIPSNTLCLYSDTVATRDAGSTSGFAVLLSGTRTGSCSSKKSSNRLVIIIVVAAILGFAVLLGAFLTICYWNRVRKGFPCCKEDWEVEMK